MEHDVAPPYYYRALLPVYIALDNAPILWHAIGLIWFAMTCYGPKSEFADVRVNPIPSIVACRSVVNRPIINKYDVLVVLDVHLVFLIVNKC